MNPDFKNNFPCKECDGSCCKNMGCHLSPDDDLKQPITYESLDALLKTGNYSIDWWESYYSGRYDDEVNGYFIRVRNKNAPIVDPSWGGECSLLTETGCLLSFEDRQKGGRLLLADCNGRCKQYYSKKDCADDWFKY